MDMLYNTMLSHPRNSLGGFWHKEIYPWQMWLDGLYMGSPYLAQYAVVNNKPELLNDVIMQFVIVENFMHDSITGLYFHAWDEKKIQKWCDPETGLSYHFWGVASDGGLWLWLMFWILFPRITHYVKIYFLWWKGWPILCLNISMMDFGIR
ncbi:glycoside hydrolase family 88 protein [Bacteroides sp. CR5/BHMF/2]|nr:glycoside hydrolase family 88 protein [Bacteroides sp. CR5/BHMF/2]